METKVNLRGMIHLDQIEDLLTNLVHTVQSQHNEIVGLKAMCADYISIYAAAQKFNTAHTRIDKLEMQLNEVNRRCTSRLEDKEISAGELAIHNNRKIQDIYSVLSEAATRSELKDVAQTIINQHQTDVKSIRDWAASADVARTLQMSHKDVSARVNAIEGLVSCKLDRSEVSHIQALAGNLETFKDFQIKTSDNLRTLDSVTLKMNENLSNSVKEINIHEKEIENLNVEIRTLASRTDVRALAKEFENQSAGVRLCALKSELNKTQSEVDEANNRIKEFVNFTEILKDMTVSMNTKIQGKASISECVRRVHYDEAVTALGAAIDDKASSDDVRVCVGRMKMVEDDLKSQNEKLGIVTRFVEWFTSRGENYEHNLKIIDKHLSNLAANSSNSDGKSPYIGQIRFASVVADQRN